MPHEQGHIEEPVTPARAGYGEHEYEEEVVMDDAGPWYGGNIAARVNSVLFAGLVAIETLLALRFALLAFGANQASGFVDFIMDVSWPFVAPFDGAFANRTWDEGIIEVSTLLAMGVWLIAFVIVAMLISALLPRFHDMGGGTHARTTTRHRSNTNLPHSR